VCKSLLVLLLLAVTIGGADTLGQLKGAYAPAGETVLVAGLPR
jgi:hypothetical protein